MQDQANGNKQLDIFSLNLWRPARVAQRYS